MEQPVTEILLSATSWAIIIGSCIGFGQAVQSFCTHRSAYYAAWANFFFLIGLIGAALKCSEVL
jgi:hypothetical protein